MESKKKIRQIDDEAQAFDRRNFLWKGCILGGGAAALGLLGGYGLRDAQGAPGAGASGTTITDEDIDAKRIAGVRVATEFITGAIPAGTDADPYPGSAIQAAIDDLPADGGLVFMPAGVYAEPTILTISVTKHGVRLRGASPHSTILKKIQFDLQPAETSGLDRRHPVDLSDFRLTSDDTGIPAGSIAINLSKTWGAVLRNIIFDYWETAVKTGPQVTGYGYQTRVQNCSFWTNKTAVWLKETGSNKPNIPRIIDNDFTIDSAHPIYQSGSILVKVDSDSQGLEFIGNHCFGSEKVIEFLADQTTYDRITGNYFENNLKILSTDDEVTPTFRKVFAHIQGNAGLTIPTTHTVLNYIRFQGDIQTILGATFDNRFAPDNTESEWTGAWCKIPNGTVLVGGDNVFNFNSSSKMHPVRYGGIIVSVSSRANIAVPFTIYARDEQDVLKGRLTVHLVLTSGLTLTSDFIFFVKWVFHDV